MSDHPLLSKLMELSCDTTQDYSQDIMISMNMTCVLHINHATALYSAVQQQREFQVEEYLQRVFTNLVQLTRSFQIFCF